MLGMDRLRQGVSEKFCVDGVELYVCCPGTLETSSWQEQSTHGCLDLSLFEFTGLILTRQTAHAEGGSPSWQPQEALH